VVVVVVVVVVVEVEVEVEVVVVAAPHISCLLGSCSRRAALQAQMVLLTTSLCDFL
jgi:hypothetical protein